MICEDFLNYTMHRIGHFSTMYKYHKVHHEHKVTFCLAPIHTHPIDFIIGTIFPLMLGPTILRHRLHKASLFGW